MKRFFAKASKPSASSNKPLPPSGAQGASSTTVGISTSGVLHAPALQPKYVVPPVPHPFPHDHLAILATNEGLLVRPQYPGQDDGAGPGPCICIPWGKSMTVRELADKEKAYGWSESVIVYGIVGVLELYSSPYLFVITARSEIGCVLDQSYKVYGIKSVAAIPLSEDRARSAINLISSRNAILARPSLLPRTSSITDLVDESDYQETPPVEVVGSPTDASHRVQFSPEPQVKLVTPTHVTFEGNLLRPSSPQSFSSSISTPSSEQSTATSPILKTLATRLSFWSRVSKRNSISQQGTLPSIEPPQSAAQEHETLDRIIQEAKEEPTNVIRTILATTAPPPATTEERHSELEDKVVRECIREFTKGGMYYSYTFDITRSLQHKQELVAKSQKQHELLAGLGALPSPETDPSPPDPKPGTKVSAVAEPYPTLPLWRRVDKRFWWNEWMSKHFIDAGLHSYVLPIMQGYFQVANFVIPSEFGQNEECGVSYIIVSRRSRDRAGLRYQRRGIDEEAHVANFVETETIMRIEREGKDNIFSYVQIRGSIPLFWTQSGYGLKPPPVLAPDRTREQNLDALRRHFKRTIPSYGPQTIVNLAEQQGKEAAITQAYRDYMKDLEFKDAQYHEYDFHKETKGMKYENISKLIDAMERVFDAQGYLWISHGTVYSQQKGTFRVNCIDCLDRTNVVQSAFARYVMDHQLGALALPHPSSTRRPEIDSVFNDVWANNGDAISRAYAGTSALKGDFTRTGRRDLSGLLNDGVNSLARMYTSTFSDWFCQAVIDFMLGNRAISVFSEFLLRLQSSDPRDLIKLSKIRAEAIATSVSRVLPEGERLLSGWTLFAPEELNTKIGLKFEEKVLLLTMKALYIVSYDYTLEKVKLYTRVPLGDIIGISKGAYILSPLEEASRDTDQNAGFIIAWNNSNQESRATSYSVRNSFNSPTFDSPLPIGTRSAISHPALQLHTKSLSRKATATLSWLLTNPSLASTGTGEKMFATFKALPIDPARIRQGSSTSSGLYTEMSEEVAGASCCREVVDRIVESICRAYEDTLGRPPSREFVKNEDVVSLTEAQRTTTMYAKMEYGVKRLLWLGG